MARGDVDPGALCDVVAREWGVRLDRVERVPFGYAASSYLGSGAGQPNVVVKVWPPSQVPRVATLALSARLGDALTIARVPAPARARGGSMTARLGDHVVGVFPFVAGRHLGGWDDPACAQLPVALAGVHALTPHLVDLDLEVDDFAMDAAVALRAGMEQTDRRRHERGAIRSLARFFDDEQATLRGALERLDAVERRAGATPCERVVCHSDSGGNNCLVDADGTLWLLDWDDAVMAPPEEDLKTGAHLRVRERHDACAFVEAYASAPGARPLHLDHLEFFVLRRPVEDIAADTWRILQAEDPEPESTIEALRVSDWSVRRFGVIDDILGELAGAEGVVRPRR